MEKSILNDLKSEAIRRAKQSNLGLQSREAAVLLSLMSEVDLMAGEAEVTSVRTVLELATELGFSEHQVQRSLMKLRDLGFIARRQNVKRAGESAFTTILPAAFGAMGVEVPGGAMPTETLPKELAELLCCQPWSVVEAVSAAWVDRAPLPDHLMGDLRGPHYGQLKRLLDIRAAELHEEQEAAIEAAMELEDLREAGFDRVETADGTAVVNVRAFEQACPEETSWSFVKDVLTLMHSRRPGLVTLANLRDRIAEAAYARAALPFVREKGRDDAVRLLARQMEIRWDRPRRIWPGWYATVEGLIHKPALSAH